MIQVSLLIPAASVHGLEVAIRRLARRATKLNCTPPTVVVDPAVVPVLEMMITDDEGLCSFEWIPAVDVDAKDRRQTGRSCDAQRVTVTGEAPQLAGWTFAATLSPLGGINIVKSLQEDTNFDEYRNDVGRCDHCNKPRNRKDTYVVQHEDGTRKVVGKNCLKDFLGHTSPEQLAKYASYLAEFIGGIAEDYVDGDEGFGARGEKCLQLDHFLAKVAGWSRKFGYVTRTAAKESFDGLRATANEVFEHLTSKQDDDWERLDEDTQHTPKDIALIDQAIQWAKTMDVTGNDYLGNLQVIAQAGVTTWKLAGYASSLIGAYERHIDKQTAAKVKAARPDSQHVGEIGKRQVFRLTVKRVISTCGYYGATGIHIMEDEHGNDVKWFASESADWLDRDDVIECKATPKKHDHYNGRPQTTVSRLAVIKQLAE